MFWPATKICYTACPLSLLQTACILVPIRTRPLGIQRPALCLKDADLNLTRIIRDIIVSLADLHGRLESWPYTFGPVWLALSHRSVGCSRLDRELQGTVFAHPIRCTVSTPVRTTHMRVLCSSACAVRTGAPILPHRMSKKRLPKAPYCETEYG